MSVADDEVESCHLSRRCSTTTRSNRLLAHRLAVRLDYDDLIRQAFTETVLARLAPMPAPIWRRRWNAIRPATGPLPLPFFKGYQAIQTHCFAPAMFKAGRRDFELYLQSRSS